MQAVDNYKLGKTFFTTLSVYDCFRLLDPSVTDGHCFGQMNPSITDGHDETCAAHAHEPHLGSMAHSTF